MKLDIGCGLKAREGFTGVDRRLNGGEAFPVCIHGDVLSNDSVEEIVASHVLEHFPKADSLSVVTEWVRVLKPGGLIRIAVPDFQYAINNPNHPHFEGWIMGGQTHANDFHHAIFTRAKLEAIMELAGLECIEPWKSDIEDCAGLPVSLNLQGRKVQDWKPHPLSNPPKKPTKVSIACALSMPRLGFNDSWGCIQTALAPWKIPVRQYRGCWWEKCLQNVLEDMIEDGIDYALCADYDSVFTPEQFEELLGTIVRRSEIDAIAAMQPQRGTGYAMFKPLEGVQGNSMRLNNDPIQVHCAHFGLTILRLNRLRDLPKPWFKNVPGKDGSWRQKAEGQIDADIYFWNQWNAHGRSLYMLPAVSIGHIETLVSTIDLKSGRNVHVFMQDWYDKRLSNVREVQPKKA